jgi:prepilin-type processing-associated H-X9-DG protein
MKTQFPRRGQRAITFVEMLCGVAVVLLMGLVVLPLMQPRGCKKSPATACVNNLKQIGLAFRIYANDHNDLYPMQIPDDQGGAEDSVERGDIVRVFLVLSNELSVPKTVICPADTRVAATNWNVLGSANISYFIGLDAVDTRPNMVLAGDRHLKRDGRPLSGIVALGTNSSLTWADQRHQELGNIAMADGSVQQVTRKLLWQQLAYSGDTTNRVLFPQ